MQVKHTIISLFCSFLSLVTLQVWGQNLPSTCGGSRVRYGVSGLPASVFNWEVTGGTILNNYNDSIDVEWGETEGIKTIKVTEYTQNKCIATPQIGYVMISAPEVGLEDHVEICQGETHTFTPTASFSLYKWSTGDTGASLTTGQAGTYWVEVVDSKGCKGRDSSELVINQGLPVNLGRDTTICPDEKLTLDAGFGGTSYVWSDGSIGQSTDISYGKPQSVWVNVTNDKGCTSTDTIRINACDLGKWITKFNVPNAFTPNGDNENDTWKLPWIQFFPDASVEVFDRWGIRVLQTSTFPSDGWDGRANGKPLPMDSYYYIINLHNGIDPIVGNVTLIR